MLPCGSISSAPLLRTLFTSVDTARRYPSAIGAPIAFRLDPDFVYLFDPATGRVLRQARFTSRRTV